ncbi:PP2C family protein-serine/threonine phosphatase [Caenispirillum bisanense]|uniref:Sigma-B regulation protein RsbU (Phosphoserine phosphatase) n=1 Tax=Caenispirillum bisanense TaxID=414052 RepID=A0A286GNA8_9PROT|nr:SpoIIE family protein phosphatase [Caenispirillum bisanense]SOD96982.1 sigma-B regulation protein RsbU (phosphoserine phosphatase) [Caenispirillum bisanense]
MSQTLPRIGPATAASPVVAPGRHTFRSLTLKQAAVTLVIALLFGILGSAVELVFDWRSMREEVAGTMRRTLAMVEPSAAEAAFQLNDRLAEQVARGLAEYPAVAQVTLIDDMGGDLATFARGTADADGTLADRLFGDLSTWTLPLVHEGRPVGTLEVGLTAEVAAERFFERATTNAAMGLLRAFAICGVVVLAFYLMITRPLLRLSQQVMAVDPANPGATPVPPAAGHRHDELGGLIDGLNGLMSAFQRGLDQRDKAEGELTALTLELEARVEQRTAALAAAKQEIEQLNGRLAAENVRLGAELDVSRKIQGMLLPKPEELAAIRGLDLATYMQPASEVGGDYYDILQSGGDRVRIGIGDVTGHGLESGVVMLMTQSAVRTLVASDEQDMGRMLGILNRTIYDNVQRMGSDKNLTLALLDHTPREGGGGSLRIGGQHESVIVVRGDGSVELVDTTWLGMPLGLVDTVEEFVGETEVTLAPGDGVVLYTDGITEAADASDALYGLDRLCRVVSDHWAEPADRIKQAVVDDVMRHIGGHVIYDDLTLIVLKQK